MTYTHAVSTTLRAIRARLDLTQEQLAARLGVSFASVNRWEGGVNMPQKAARAAIVALAAEAGIDTSEPVPGEAESAKQVTRRRTRRNRRSAVPSTKPMEQMLWDAACPAARLSVKLDLGELLCRDLKPVRTAAREGQWGTGHGY